ncbi:MAG: 30S ribosomal protein S12 methylthiotransferase RimO [Gammaproteobacteria bacterium]|nr:30S ribosomal protein S12 methylthiotransferase RimO [Gammaproteobacteria bacterium]NBR18365.1 30S ribosomal protein S12 methylthiotransferase RimO [Gammaproteobacteria bacterium]NCW57896.1 30S ribosomal protein S12 methylthiotransferase RimO [Gammaproteobacteria bacterium]NDB17431.1 30S ribosomal protein S12 methylthiotransferase RimO [Gammaproteobacteria bacterium]
MFSDFTTTIQPERNPSPKHRRSVVQTADKPERTQVKCRVSRKNPKVGFVSLGCPKALVDSERILTQLRAEGYTVAPDYDSADVVVVNTCGFIDSAIDESLDAIGEAIEQNGKVIVTGCLGANPQRILDRHPRVLKVTGPHAYDDVITAVHQHLPPKHDPFVDLVPPQGVRLTPRHYAYLKISEGCNNKCSFCIIPDLRGKLASRRIDDVLREAERLVKAGVRELLVISQDTSAYGSDLRYAKASWGGREIETRFIELARGLGSLGVWVRMHYVYPYPHVDEVMALMAEGRVLPYLDIPFQHGSPSVLKRMKRPAHAENTLDRIRAWRHACPELTLRSTFIVGFPGETEAEFKELLGWLEAAELDRVGAFKYSPVEGARANDVAPHVAAEIQEERLARFMEVAQRISAARLAARVGRTEQVLVDAIEGNVAIARSRGDAPEIDGIVRIKRGGKLAVGEFATVKITAADDYDLEAVPA